MSLFAFKRIVSAVVLGLALSLAGCSSDANARNLESVPAPEFTHALADEQQHESLHDKLSQLQALYLARRPFRQLTQNKNFLWGFERT